MNDNNILACIEFAQKEGLACAEDARNDYQELVELAQDNCPTCKGTGKVRTIKGVEDCLHPVHRFSRHV